jgi:hypothetical protein
VESQFIDAFVSHSVKIVLRRDGGLDMRQKGSILESVYFLAIIGLLAGALGGLAVGIVTGRPASTTSSASK